MKRQLAAGGFLKNDTLRRPIWQEIVDFSRSNVPGPQSATG
jgi:hypothetical protein